MEINSSKTYRGASHIDIYYEKRHCDVSLKKTPPPWETSHLFIDIDLAPNKRPYWVNIPLLHLLDRIRGKKAVALSMALLLSIKFQKSDEWLIVHDETSVISVCEQAQIGVTLVSSYVCSNSPTISAIIEIKAQCIFLKWSWVETSLNFLSWK